MKSSPRRGLEVFDFGEEDEHPESAQGKYLGKFRNPSNDNNPILKYEFLENVSEGAKLQTKDIRSIPCEDVELVDHDHCCDNAISHSLLGAIEENLAANKEYMELDAAPQSQCLSHEQPSDSKLRSHGSISFLSEPERKGSNASSQSSGKSQLHCALAVSPSSNEPVDVISDADESKSDSPSSSASEMEEDDVYLGTCKLGPCSGNLEMLHNLQDNINMTVVLYPDYVVYRDSYCTEPQLTFSHSCIKISGSTTSELHGTFNFEWGVDDLINVECQRFRKAEFVMIKLRVISKDTPQDDDADGTSGIEELKIAVVEPYWSQQQQRIASLNVKYLNAWVGLQDMDMETDEDDSLGQRHHFPNFDEPFEDVVYPEGDADAVSISKRDVDLLQPETFINDTIIDFYIKYLKNQIQPEGKHRFHFFNSFFFRKLADLDKDPSSISDGRAAFQRVRKWTRKVDLFEKDYIFIPINFSLHWSLIVICHPGEVPRLNDGDSGKSLKVPCILHMDSIKGSHMGLKNLVQSYLWEEWKERKKETSEEISSKFHNMRFVSLELPQQENSFDCGLFLLHYLELFLAEAPLYFSPFGISKYSNFLNANWFLPSEASLKRTIIQRLIFELLENRYREAPPAASSDEDKAKFPECDEHETGVQSFSGRCGPAIACQENISSSQSAQGIEITLLSTSSLRSSECVNDAGLVLRELFEPGATTGSLFEQYQPFDQKSSFYRLNEAIPPVEEDTEPGEHFTFLPTGDSALQQITGIASPTCSIPYTSRAYGAETSFDLGVSAQAENGNIDSPKPSICASDHSEDIGIIENHQVGEDLVPSRKEEMDVNNCPSMENVTWLTDGLVCTSANQDASIIEGSQDHDKVHDGNENGGSHDHDKVHDGNGNGGSLDSDGVHDVNGGGGSQNRDEMHDVDGNGGSLDRDEVHEGGSQDHDKVHDGNGEGGSQGPDKVHDGNENEGSQDQDTVHNGNEIGGIQDHDEVHDGNGDGSYQVPDKVHDGNGDGGSIDHDKVHDGNGDGGSQDPDKVHDDNENEGSHDRDKVLDANENGGSQAHDKVRDGIENGGPHSSCQENPDIPTHQDSDMVDNRLVLCDDVQMFDDGPVTESQQHQAAKRLRLTPPLEQDSDMVDNRTVLCNDVQMLVDGPVPESEEQQAAKRLRLTPPLEGEKCFT